jgi:dTDP-D-glucose 4,6-dehydratase
MTRSCNVYGPSQKHDNLIPHIINSLIEDKPIHIHGTGTNFRQYIYVEDKINAIMRILERGKINEVYNIGASNYCTNLDMVKSIGYIMMKKPVIEFIPDRKAHDFGYLVDNTKLKLLGWQSRQEFYQGLSKTAQFYMRQHESNIIYNK